MAKSKVGKDARGRALRVDDYVIDDRGRVYMVDHTEASFRRNNLVRVLPLKSGILQSHTYTQTGLVFRRRQPGTEAENKELYKRLWRRYASPAKRREIARMKRGAQRALTMPLRPCPACANGNEPVRFKLGVSVWRGRRLRVCGGGCVRHVKKEVRKLQRDNPDYDREKLRRRVAWKYIRIANGGTRG